MDYSNLYKELTSVSDDIRSGTFSLKKPKVQQPSNSIMKRTMKQGQKEAQPSTEEMLAGYFSDIHNEEPAAVEVRTPNAPLAYSPAALGTPVKGDVGAAREAIAAVESRGSGDYAAIGPVVQKGMYKGDRAYGRYQVMGKNIPSWTKEVLGKAMTTEEFMASPEAQDRVVEYQLQKSKEKYGTWEDAASVWFSGGPLAKNKDRSDGYNTVPQYVSKFQNAYRETQNLLAIEDKPIMQRRP